MRKYSVVVTEAAERDLTCIVDYVSNHLSNPSAATSILDELKRLVEDLERLPGAHAVVRDELLALAGYRWSAVGPYMAFFTVDEDSGTVNIERVLHSTMNWREIPLLPSPLPTSVPASMPPGSFRTHASAPTAPPATPTWVPTN